MKKKIVISLCIYIILSLSGCIGMVDIQDVKDQQGNEREKEKEMIQLTERQISILEEVELPTKVEELTETQLAAIINMEELFQHLDKKYDEEFVYAGYIFESYLDTEELIVQVKDGTSLDMVSVYRRDGVITDDYANWLVKEPYQELTNSFFQQYEGGLESKTFSDIYSVEGDMDTENLLSIVSASSGIFIPESEINLDELNELGQKFGEWCAKQANGRCIGNNIIILKDNDYEVLNKFNVSEYQHYNEKKIKCIDVGIDDKGEVEIKID